VVLAGSGLFIGQILVARSQPFRLAVAWFVALVVAALVVMMPVDDPVTLVTLAFLVGEAAALLALVAGALMRDRQEGAVPTGYAVVKRSLDIAVSLVMTILTLPVLLAAALAVRLNSPGPAFFRQQRVGKDGVEFWMVKLRTMVIDHGEEVFHSHLDRLAEAGDVDDMYTIRIDDDPRVTTVGAKLRKWSLDELPNLWNVLKGNMSLVGPRPLVVAEAELIGYDNPRFTVRPGVTGLAQVRGRDSISLEERTGYDEIYVAERSMKGDLKILLATFGTVFRQPGKEED
jgi:lipopolysaccharide/colanic/teichoic acid biosynthesis glycosyltransferase